MALVVELIGLPGSGKSTLAGLVATDLAAAGRTVVRSTPPSNRTKATAAFRYRDVLALAVRTLARSPRPAAQKIAALRFITVTLERYVAALADPSDAVYVFDEGSLQRLFMLFVEADGAHLNKVNGYVSIAPLADIIVSVDTRPDQVLARLHHRDRKLPDRLAHLDDVAAEELLAEAAELFATAAEVAQRQPSRPTVGTRQIVGPVASDDAASVVGAVVAFRTST